MRVLVLGGAGYIGSHACVALAARGHAVAVVDDFRNAFPAALDAVDRLVGQALPRHAFDIRDTRALAAAMAGQGTEAVLHFAADKAVAPSVAAPLPYFENNVGGTLSLLRAMQEAGVRHLVFSSSAAVYGNAATLPIPETAPLQVVNPYGRSKLVMEQLIGDVCAADPALGAVFLRYFNPIGAHASGTLGEHPRGVPHNLFPYLARVAAGKRPHLRVHGKDWPTPDGTAIRDYLHVEDLARAHVDALEWLAAGPRGATAINLGTGRGTSVLELVAAFERVTGRRVPCEFTGRRPGDVAALWADPSLARELLGWEARLDLDRMCADTWRWQSMNPDGYGDPAG